MAQMRTLFIQNSVGWLILCEQWPHAANGLLRVLDHNLRARPAEQALLLQRRVSDFYAEALPSIQESAAGLQKLMQQAEQLQPFLAGPLAHMALADLQLLRPFTINFNPALHLEVQKTLENPKAD